MKMMASLSFVFTAILAYISNRRKSQKFKKFGLVVIAASCLSCIADYTIYYSFLAGMATFLLALIVYFLSCFTFGMPGKKFYIVTLAVYIPFITIVNLLPGFSFEEYTIPVAVYAFTILIFTVKAFDVFKNKSIYAKMLPLGALVFLISDFVMLVQMFYNLSQAAVDFYDGLNLFLYFPAQLLIANSLSEDYL